MNASMPHLIKAQQAIGAGDLKAARALLDAHLRQHPHDFDGLYLSGVCEQASGHADRAQDIYRQILEINPNHFAAHYNLALLLSTLGRHTEALPHHNEAVRLAPDNHWASLNRGNSRAALGQHQAALEDFDRALALQPTLPEAWTNKGNALAELRQLKEALVCHERAIAQDTAHAAAWANRSGVQIRLLQDAEALQSAERALQLAPAHAPAWVCKGIALHRLGRSEQALSCVAKALELAPGNVDAWLARGDILTDLGRDSEGFACYDECLRIAPRAVKALINQGVVLADRGLKDAARNCFERALAIVPDEADAQWNLSVLDIQTGDFALGWNRFEARWQASTSENRPLTSNRPRWDGTASGQPLLLWGEQGLGDQILYASILPELSTLPQRKYLALDRRLVPLFTRSMPGFEFVDLAQVSDAMDFATQLPLGSLPRLFRNSLQSFASTHYPYLLADPARVCALRERIARPGKRICGVSWLSSRKTIGAQKSIGLAQMLTPLANEDLHFVDLQYGDTSAERLALQTQQGIEVQHLDDVDNFHDLDGLAALIQACDVVITTSNTTAHLAGALGKETLLLLPFGKGRLWYWSMNDGHNLWYPSIQCFSQHQPGDWSQPLTTIKARLASKD